MYNEYRYFKNFVCEGVSWNMKFSLFKLPFSTCTYLYCFLFSSFLPDGRNYFRETRVVNWYQIVIIIRGELFIHLRSSLIILTGECTTLSRH